MRNIVLILIFLILLSNQLAYAIPCSPIKLKIENNNLVIPGRTHPNTAQIVFFKNTSPQSIFIDRASKNPGASAGWATYLRPGKWAGLVLNQNNFTVSCVMVQPGKVIPLNCAKTLSVCSPQNITSTKPLKGNYWLVEDKSWDELVKMLGKKNIKIS